MEKNNQDSTPMMAQYLAIKNQHPDNLLFYRMGDFYELFFDDAIKAAKDLDIALTKRGKHQEKEIPMCGVPVNSHEMYLLRLIQKGHNVAICEQTETPEQSKKRGNKGPLKREVVRIITSGTICEESLLTPKKYNFLMAISLLKDGNVGVVYLDISVGQIYTEKNSLESLPSLLARIQPAEIILSNSIYEKYSDIFFAYKKKLKALPDPKFDYQNNYQRVLNFYKVKSIDSFGNFSALEIQAMGVAIDYLETTQKQSLQQIGIPKQIIAKNFLEIDESTRKSLDLISYDKDLDREKSLFYNIDQTVTASGGRLLSQRLSAPLMQIDIINLRLDKVEFFYKKREESELIRNLLKKSPDIERSLSRLFMQKGTPKDLKNLQKSLEISIEIKSMLKQYDIWNSSCKTIEDLDLAVLKCFENALQEELSPNCLKDGNFIKDGFNAQLDHYRTLQKNAQEFLENLQKKYCKNTGINNLKIKYNNIIGYYIDITPSNASKIPENFIHRQTLASSLRYTTPDLAKLADELEYASVNSLKLELEIFQNLIDLAKEQSLTIYSIAYVLADIDVASSLGVLAQSQNYSRPIIDQSLDLEIIEARHPVVEKFNRGENFVSNDCIMDENKNFMLLTGPNMAGKSTYLRQNAIIIILAQAGSFVPASYARIGVVDRIFSRVGASDDLAAGRSTFMVEMVETATILRHASQKSFVILDEIGRGTSTYDGMAIARAVSEALHDDNKSRCIFATHYHELTSMINYCKKMECKTMEIEEWNEKIVFLHKVISGQANKSYGIHVAQLAGIPDNVIERAKSILCDLEKKH
jgi:DNA mismatch repair protein MutS